MSLAFFELQKLPQTNFPMDSHAVKDVFLGMCRMLGQVGSHSCLVCAQSPILASKHASQAGRCREETRKELFCKIRTALGLLTLDMS